MDITTTGQELSGNRAQTIWKACLCIVYLEMDDGSVSTTLSTGMEVHAVRTALHSTALPLHPAHPCTLHYPLPSNVYSPLVVARERRRVVVVIVVVVNV